MSSKEGCSKGSKPVSLVKRRLKWLILGVSSLSAVSIGLLPALSLPALCAELSSWRYDSRSRSLTLTLPGDTTPTVSVTAPNQLLVELPDTQIGAVREQRVNDGFVEQIALEQATPETLWIVVDFVPGTVLSDTQQATPLAASSNAIQLWKVQPTLVAGRRAVDAAVASQAEADADAGAADLAVESPQGGRVIAQADFPDLPVLEPAVPQNQLVVVPPINAAPAVSVPEIAEPAVEIPVIESDAAEAEIEPAPPVATEPSAPIDPPFIGEVDGEVGQNVNTAVVEAAPVLSPDPGAASRREEIADSRFENDSGADASGFEFPTDLERASETSRWPEPIPFGQPLP